MVGPVGKDSDLGNWVTQASASTMGKACSSSSSRFGGIHVRPCRGVECYMFGIGKYRMVLYGGILPDGVKRAPHPTPREKERVEGPRKVTMVHMLQIWSLSGLIGRAKPDHII